jgi:hypothetical protein
MVLAFAEYLGNDGQGLKPWEASRTACLLVSKASRLTRQARSAWKDAQSASPPKPKELVPEGRCDRSLARSAWEIVIQESRPVGYGLIRAGGRTDSSNRRIGVTNFRNTKLRNFVRYYFYLAFLKKHGAHFAEEIPLGLAPPIILYPTGRFFDGRFSRHFVPGYDRCCPYGTC